MRRIQLVLAMTVAIASILGSIGVASAQDGTTTQTASSDVSTTGAFVITEVKPDGGETGVNRGITIRAGFNEDLDKNSVTNNTFYLQDQDKGGKKVPAKVSVDNSPDPSKTEDNSTTSFAYLNPKDKLVSGHTYKVIVESNRSDGGVFSKSGDTVKAAPSDEGVTYNQDTNRSAWSFKVQ